METHSLNASPRSENQASVDSPPADLLGYLYPIAGLLGIAAYLASEIL